MSYSSTALRAPAPAYVEPVRTLHQIVDAEGNACDANGTSNIDVHYSQVFSDPVGGNTVTPLLSGKAYFEALIKALRAATSEVLIAGWQINWDAQLTRELRLYDVLLEIAKKDGAPKIYVMPWDNPSAVNTYAKPTELALLDINAIVGKQVVFVHRSPTHSDEDALFFSHHQKQVVVDRKIAFVGGIDIAYGRFDDEAYCLQADAEGRDGQNRYNSCVPPCGSMKAAEVDPDLLSGGYDALSGNRKETRTKIAHGGLQALAGDAPRASLDPSTQPRMPWQDLQQRIEGPAAINLAANFVLRWNAGATPKLPVPALATTPLPGKSGCSVQVLRSASAKLRAAEFQPFANMKPEVAKGVFPNQKGAPAGKQDDILRAMLQLIEQSQHYIYIENQFFTSAFGTDVPGRASPLSGPAKLIHDNNAWSIRATRVMPGDADGPIRNAVCEKLGQRLYNAVIDPDKEPFHVYLVLPVHPEGLLDGGPTMTQIHWTMQSLVFGSNSLVNQVKCALREVKREESEWTQYLTLLNLRNWAKLGDRYVTEQIYVHTKLMIVDDRYVLHGSANINDRSLLGSRDSEIAVLIHDSEDELVDLCGNGRPVLTLKHARNLRKAVWRKLFGLELTSCPATGGATSAGSLAAFLDRPADPATAQAIQSIAKANTGRYEAAFSWIPRGRSLFDERAEAPSSIWSQWNAKARTGAEKVPGSMPFESAFWKAPHFNIDGAKDLALVQGFITSLPVLWTQNENNNVGYHTNLMVRNETPARDPLGPSDRRETEVAQNEALASEEAT